MLSQSDFLEQVWIRSINRDPQGKWVRTCIKQCRMHSDGPFADAGPVLERMLDAGVSVEDLGRLARLISYEACFSLITLLEDEGLEKGELAGMHESLLDADPAGMEGRPGSWPVPKRRGSGTSAKAGLRITPGNSFSLAFSPDGSRVAAADRGHIWDVATLKEVAKCNILGNTLRVLFSPNGKQLAAINTSGKVAVCDPQSGERLFTLSIDGEGDALAFSPDGKLLAAGNRDTIGIFNCRTGKAVARLAAPADGWLRFVDASVVAAGSGLVCRHYDIRTERELSTIEFPGAGEQAPRLDELRLDPTDSRRGLTFDSIRVGATMIQLDGKHKPIRRKLKLDEAGFSPDGALIAAVRKHDDSAPDGFLVLDGRTLETLCEIPAEYPNDVAFSADGKRLALATWKKGQIWDVAKLPVEKAGKGDKAR